MKKQALLFMVFLSATAFIQAQSVDIGAIGKGKPLKINGGVSANTVFFNSNTESSREALTYYLNGNLNFNVYGYSIPLSFSYSNQELSYNNPFQFNRLSLHPSYKWVRAHIGDVSMSFSPYTLNGHQFSGAGVELSPPSGIKFSAMYGRLLKAVEADTLGAIPSFKRVGYGVKASYEKNSYMLGVTVFRAQDEENSILRVPEEQNITPHDNLVFSMEGKAKIVENMNFMFEYAVSGLTRDTRSFATSEGEKALFAHFFDHRATTSYYNALKAGLNYSIGASSIGVQYERVDPEYQTLGAYYFTNDMENIALTLGQSLFQDKLSLNVNLGLQRDDLEDQKSSETSRTVGSVNASYNAGEKLNFSASYSNFQTFANVKDQFDFINEVSQFDNVDTLDFKQVSESANFNTLWNIANDEQKSQSFNLNLSFQNAYDMKGGLVRKGSSSQFYNGSLSYSHSLNKIGLGINSSFNYSYNTIGSTDNTTAMGPFVTLNKKFLEQKLRTSLGVGYNTSAANGERQASVTNIRANASYVFKKKHNFNLTLINLMKSTATQSGIREFTTTLTYSYSF